KRRDVVFYTYSRTWQCTTSPIVTWALPTGRIFTTLLSVLIGASATRGAVTFVAGTAVSFDSANSSTSGKYSPDVRFICSARSSSTMFTTNWPRASTLVSVSFFPLARGEQENAIVGG